MAELTHLDRFAIDAALAIPDVYARMMTEAHGVAITGDICTCYNCRGAIVLGLTIAADHLARLSPERAREEIEAAYLRWANAHDTPDEGVSLLHRYRARIAKLREEYPLD